MLNFFVNSFNLPGAFAVAEDEIISKAGYTTGIQQDNISCQFITGGFYRFMGQF